MVGKFPLLQAVDAGEGRNVVFHFGEDEGRVAAPQALADVLTFLIDSQFDFVGQPGQEIRLAGGLAEHFQHAFGVILRNLPDQAPPPVMQLELDAFHGFYRSANRATGTDSDVPRCTLHRASTKPAAR